MNRTHGLGRPQGKISLILMTLYIWLIAVFVAMIANYTVSAAFIAAIGIVSLLLSAFIISRLSGPLSNIEFKETCSRGRCLLFSAVIGALTLAFLLLYFLGDFPGGGGQDEFWQYAQAVGDEPYNDWHPVLHTMLFFSLPYKLGLGYRASMLLQLVYFSAAFSYLVYTLRANSCPRAVILPICAYVWMNPYISTYLLIMLKGCAMMIFAMVLIGFYIQILCSKGQWLRNKLHLILFSAVTVMCSYMRHNAVLFTIPLLIVVIFYLLRDKKLRMTVLLVTALMFGLVKGVYWCAGVTYPGGRMVETIGLPCAVWCNVMQKAPETLPEDTRELLLSYAPQELYSSRYVSGNFNSIKRAVGIDLDKMNELSYEEAFKITWQCFKYAPSESVEALLKQTDIVWDPNTAPQLIEALLCGNPYGIENTPDYRLFSFVAELWSFFSSGLGTYIFGSIGLEMLAMLIVGLCLLSRGRSAIVLLIPFFCHNFGTMLLLSGEDHRFFMYNIPLWLPVIIVMLMDRNTIGIKRGEACIQSDQILNQEDGIGETT